MNNYFKRICLILTISLFGFSYVILAQSNYRITDSKDIAMKLSGTSTLHNWVMNAQTFTGEAQFVFDKSNVSQLKLIKSLSFNLIVTDLKSGEKGLDKNAYKALKTDQYKDIQYTLTNATIVPEKSGKYLIKTEGKLTIAGITKEVKMNVSVVVNADGSITCKGSNNLLMTDYKVKPPKFMLGAMKTGDAITLNYTLVYKKNLL